MSSLKRNTAGKFSSLWKNPEAIVRKTHHYRSLPFSLPAAFISHELSRNDKSLDVGPFMISFSKCASQVP
jgi:hypothetical protein